MSCVMSEFFTDMHAQAKVNSGMFFNGNTVF